MLSLSSLMLNQSLYLMSSVMIVFRRTKNAVEEFDFITPVLVNALLSLGKEKALARVEASEVSHKHEAL
jgi:hypothetical protein